MSIAVYKALDTSGESCLIYLISVELLATITLFLCFGIRATYSTIKYHFK